MADSNDQPDVPPEIEAIDPNTLADVPVHARERLGQMRKTHFFTSDLSVSEFLLVKQAGFEPLGLVMGSSIYRLAPQQAAGFSFGRSGEITAMTQALYHSRELAMTRMEEEAEALGADGIVGVRLEVNLHAWGKQIAEFLAVGTAVRSRSGKSHRNKHGKPFTSDLSGQDFWTLLRAGYMPCGMVMGNCVYYVPPRALGQVTGSAKNVELDEYTHHFYDAREHAMERLQAEAEALGAEGIVGVTVKDEQHTWAANGAVSTAASSGEIIEFFVLGTAVQKTDHVVEAPEPRLVIAANE